MPCTEAYKEHIMYTFNGFCKNILKRPIKNTPLRYAVRQLSSPMENLPLPCYLCRSTTGYQIRRTLQLLHKEMVRFRIGNPNLLPYETIVRATSGEPEAVDEVLRHYSKRITIAAIENGHIDRDAEESIKSRLVAALSKFRFDEQEV